VLSCKVPLLLSNFNEPCLFSTVSKNSQISNLMKIRPVGAQFSHTGGRADIHIMMKLIVAFRNFAKAPKNEKFSKILNMEVKYAVQCYSVGSGLLSTESEHRFQVFNLRSEIFCVH